MRIANVTNYKNNNLIEVYKVKDVPTVEMRTPVLTEKDKVRLIKQVERVVRSSQEYRDYIKYLKDYMDMTKCTYFSGLTNKGGKRISIHIHHEPFTLYDITMIVVNKHLDLDKPINILDVAEEVMYLHYTNMVGLLPLSATVHELVHVGKIVIPLQIIYGNFIKFLDQYDRWITDDLKAILEAKLIMSKEVIDNSILEKKYVYLEVDGFNLPQPLELK